MEQAQVGVVEEPPDVFGSGGGGDEPTTSQQAPARDLRAEARAIVNGADRPLTFVEVHDEIKANGYVPEGPVRTALDALTNDGSIAQKLIGDPLVCHFCKVTAAPDNSALRAVCIELARLPDDRTQYDGMTTAFDLARALVARYGTEHTSDSVETILDKLVDLGIVTAETKQVPMRAANDGEEEASPPETMHTVGVIVYGFAPGLLFSLLAPAFDALIVPDQPTLPVDGATPDKATLAVARAAVAGVYAQRLAAADRSVETYSRRAIDAERRAHDLEEKLSRAQRRAEDMGLYDLFAEKLLAPEQEAEPDPRGQPIRYEKRVPITDELQARFWRDTKGLRAEAKRLKTQEAAAKKTFDGVKSHVAERTLEIETQLDDMTSADAAGSYLIVVPSAYKEMDVSTRRVGVYDYETREFVCWDDPRDLPVGSQPALPGLDARDAATGAQPATGPKVKKKGKKKAAAKPADEATEEAEESDEDDDEDGEPQSTPPAAPEAFSDDLVAKQLDAGDDSAFKISLVLVGRGCEDATARNVESALERLYIGGHPKARYALLKSGRTAEQVDALTEPAEPAAASPATPAPAAPAASEPAPSAAPSSTPAPAAEPAPEAPMKMSLIKVAVAEMAKDAPAGILWSDRTGAVAASFKTAFAAKVGKPDLFKGPSMSILVASAVSSHLSNKTLADTVTNEGRLLYHPENGVPGAPAPTPVPQQPKAAPKAADAGKATKAPKGTAKGKGAKKG